MPWDSGSGSRIGIDLGVDRQRLPLQLVCNADEGAAYEMLFVGHFHWVEHRDMVNGLR